MGVEPLALFDFRTAFFELSAEHEIPAFLKELFCLPRTSGGSRACERYEECAHQHTSGWCSHEPHLLPCWSL